MESPLEALERRSGIRFPNLLRARDLSENKLTARRQALETLDLVRESSVVYVGSIGRAEAIEGSDDDFMLLVENSSDLPNEPSGLALVNQTLGTLDDFEAPGSQGVFAAPVVRAHLIENIGLEADDNSNTTRRMLFLLESTWASNQLYYEETLDGILERYIDQSVKDFRPPRFILNDMIRYWRTMCVDFAGKEYQGPEKWGVRNAKLRTSRKILFAGGLLPVLACAGIRKEEMIPYLKGEFVTPPTDRIASAFLDQEETIDAGARTLAAYDKFLGLLSTAEARNELETLDRNSADKSDLFQQIKKLGISIESGLLALLFQPGDSADLSRNYLVF